jgi:transcriptional regulator with XRE-family HTH domain
MKVPKDLLVNIGKNVRFYRTRKGLSQKDIAEIIGIAPTQFNRIELGTTNITAITLYKVSKALNITTDMIISGEKADQTKNRPLVEKAQVLEDSVTEEDRKLANHFFDLLLTKQKFKQIVSDLDIK